MRYTTPRFTVEVRRASRHGTGQTAQTWLAESKPQMSESTRVSLRVADTPFRTAPAEEPSQENVPPHRVGRILPSLIDEDAANWALRDSTASEKKRRHHRLAAAKGLDPVSEHLGRRNSQSMPEAGGLPAGESAKAHASEDGATQPNSGRSFIVSETRLAQRFVRRRAHERRRQFSPNTIESFFPSPRVRRQLRSRLRKRILRLTYRRARGQFVNALSLAVMLSATNSGLANAGSACCVGNAEATLTPDHVARVDCRTCRLHSAPGWSGQSSSDY